MKTRSLLISLVVGAAVIFMAAGIYAGNKAPDVIKMDNKAKAH